MKRFFIGSISTLVSTSALIAGSLTVGPDYKRPADDVPSSYKAETLGFWKEGRPLDHLPKGAWWEVFGDAELNALELKATRANQNLKAAFAAVNQARAAARIARSDLLPTLEANPGFIRERFSPNQEPDFGSLTASTFRAPLDLSYEIDLWGRVRRGFESARAEADAQMAAFQNLMLTLQADVAQNYSRLRAIDAEIGVLRRTVQSRLDQVGVMSGRLDAGVGTELDVARARTELAGTEAELAALRQRRVELENALAILVGEHPSMFKLAPRGDQQAQPPNVPAGLPSDLLERRPDVAEAERQLAAENARIGIAKAAFFPALRLTGSGGFVSADVETLFNWESRVWSIGPSISLPIFAGGRNRANLERSRARYEEAVARYRQRVLVAFDEVENALAAIRLLEEQGGAEERALRSAQQARDLSLESFKIGVTGYLDVIDADRAALQAQRANARIRGERLVAAIQLVKALGGGWSAAK